jgi:lysophospholipase L1-like esterase
MFPGNEAVNQSFRMMIHPSMGGQRVRVTFSNAYGDRPLVLEQVSIARRQAASGAAIVASTAKPLSFRGQRRVSIPAGQEAVSDGADFSFAVGDDLAVSFHAPGPTGPMSWHSEAFSTQYATAPGSGDQTADASGASFSNLDRGWLFLAGLDVQASANSATPPAIVFLGDSITDGFGSTPERNERYPDFFARRLQEAGIEAGIVNVGINSNTVTPARDPLTTGEPAVQRFARDVLARSNLKAVFILEGTNDLSFGKPAEEVYAGLVTLAQQAHARGACMVVSTVLPRNDPPQPFGWDAGVEEPQRQALNRMILASTVFDATVDLGRAMENPAVANQPFQPYFVEGLHPNSTGYEVMANAIEPELLLPAPLGRCRR